MKPNTILLLAALLLLITLFAFTGSHQGKDKASEKIDLVKREDGTRSATLTEVTSFIQNNNIIIRISIYSGLATINIEGKGDSKQQEMQVNDSGCIIMDISFLPEGTYSLCILLDNGVYEGYFEK